jgi:hypothetical protein
MTDPRRNRGRLRRARRHASSASDLFPPQGIHRTTIADEPIFGLASDVAANIFVVLFLALAVALSIGHVPRVAETYDLTSSPRIVERTPLGPTDLVAALFRRQAMATTAIDLLPDRMRLITEGRIREWTWDRAGDSLGALSAVAGDTGAIDLFVFDPHGYAFLQRAMQGHRLIELSVPAALRACPGGRPQDAGCPSGGDWSNGYQRLFGVKMSASDFRAALAQLLSARAEADKVQMRGADHGSAAPPRRASTETPAQQTSVASGPVWLVLFFGVLAGVELIARARRFGPRARA